MGNEGDQCRESRGRRANVRKSGRVERRLEGKKGSDGWEEKVGEVGEREAGEVSRSDGK